MPPRSPPLPVNTASSAVRPDPPPNAHNSTTKPAPLRLNLSDPVKKRSSESLKSCTNPPYVASKTLLVNPLVRAINRNSRSQLIRIAGRDPPVRAARCRKQCGLLKEWLIYDFLRDVPSICRRQDLVNIVWDWGHNDALATIEI